MCLAAGVPLIESGTAGYLGQVSVIKKGVSECYECQPKPVPKQFPACTIRNTPSAMVHCIAWSKFLFNHLFGVVDAENDVAPTSEDPEMAEEDGEAGAAPSNPSGGSADGAPAKSTRQWAEENAYDGTKLFHKLFHDDIGTLLSMEKLWRKRRKPTPLKATALPEVVTDRARDASKLPDQRIWSLQVCADKFVKRWVCVREVTTPTPSPRVALSTPMDPPLTTTAQRGGAFRPQGAGW